jgi:cell fate regulator YaaT (PSP1 superfamily)
VVIAPTEIADSELTEPLKPVVRKAEPEDIVRDRELDKQSQEALAESAKLVSKMNLPMKLLSSEYNLSGNRLTIFFSAPERVDFRDLVRDLTGRFKVRIELRQVGPRDEARLIGGFGRCGRSLCCLRVLDSLEPVSIKMAKEQDLPLNPMKISGVCGRLMCCLGYEFETYHTMRDKLPRRGQPVKTPLGPARVISTNTLKETVMVELESGATSEVALADITLEKEPARPPKKEPD